MNAPFLHHSNESSARRWLHSIWQWVLGFVWTLSASLFLVIGGGLAFLGVGGHLLVRARPDTGNVINYDPSTVATFSPFPIAIGMLLVLGFVVRERRSRS